MKIVQFAEEHPWEAGGIVFAGGLILLWLLGFFSKAPAASGGGNAGLAQAYYAAEAAQTVAGTQLQIAQANGVAQTAQAQIAADAAVKINGQNTAAATAITQTNATAATDISATNAKAATDINGQNTSAGLSAALASDYSNLLSIIVPQEMAMNGGSAAVSIPFFGGGNVAVSAGLTTGPNTLAEMGFDPSQIAHYFHDTSFGSGAP